MSQRLSELVNGTDEVFHAKLSPVTTGEKQRTCVICERVRHISLFKTTTGSNRYVRTCELCRAGRKRPRKMRLTPSHWERTAALMALPDFERRRAKTLWAAARTRAWRYGIDFTLTDLWIANKLAAGKCEATGLPFVIACIGKNRFSPSIDRRNPREGYTPENCQMVVWSYNMAKGVGTHEEVVRMARALVAQEDARTALNLDLTPHHG